MDTTQLEIAEILKQLHTLQNHETDEERLEYLAEMESLGEKYLETFLSDYAYHKHETEEQY